MKDSFKKGFESAKEKAEGLIQDKQKTQKLLDEALRKAEKNEGIFKESRDDFYSLFRMLSAWAKGNYKKAPTKVIISAIAAVIYFLNPMDIIPDFILGVGFVDDLTILGFVLSMIKTEIKEFTEWEKTSDK